MALKATYGVSKSSVQRWVRTDPKIRKRRRKREVKKEILNCIADSLSTNPLSTIQMVCSAVQKHCGLKQSVRTTGRLVAAMGFSRKKAFRGVVHDQSPERALEFCNQYQRITDDTIVCIDEAAFFVGDHERYGYAPRGQRLRIMSPRGLRRRKLTLIMAVTSSGVIHYDVLDGNGNKNNFIRFVKTLRVPKGTTLVMDNVAFHHSRETMSAVADIGCIALFIPPYSPRYNAIEYAFSAMKRLYRSACYVGGTVDSSVDPHDLVAAVVACHDGERHMRPYFEKVRKNVSSMISTYPDDACSGYDG